MGFRRGTSNQGSLVTEISGGDFSTKQSQANEEQEMEEDLNFLLINRQLKDHHH